MRSASQFIVILLLILLGVGCSKQNPVSRDSDHFLNATQGYLRLQDVESKDVQYVLSEVAKARKWERVSNHESGSYAPGTGDDFGRATYVYEDGRGREIRVDWVWEKGRDMLVLISTAPSIMESVSTALGVNILRRQQGLPLLTEQL